jgi:hypothetical protein
MKEAALDLALDRVGELQSRPGEIVRDLALGATPALLDHGRVEAPQDIRFSGMDVRRRGGRMMKCKHTRHGNLLCGRLFRRVSLVIVVGRDLSAVAIFQQMRQGMEPMRAPHDAFAFRLRMRDTVQGARFLRGAKKLG